MEITNIIHQSTSIKIKVMIKTVGKKQKRNVVSARKKSGMNVKNDIRKKVNEWKPKKNAK